MSLTPEVYGQDIYTEAAGDPDTLGNLGPLRPMAGVWEGTFGHDDHPVAGGSGLDAYVEHYELQPIDRQTNGPQLFFGLRCHTHIVRPGETETFHDQVGYWLWEPAAHAVVFTLAIPRGQVLLAGGTAEPDATEFEVRAALGSDTYGIASNPFLDRAFRTLSFRMTVTVHRDGSWSYDEEAVLQTPDRDEPYLHTDRNVLRRVSPPSPNPLAAEAAEAADAAVPDAGLGIGDLRQEERNLP